MPFLDLEEELATLGPGTSLGFDHQLRVFRLAEDDTPERRAQKAASARKAYARENPPGTKRRYERHPPGTPRHLKGDREKARARQAEYQKNVARPRKRREKEIALQSMQERREQFVRNMEKAGILGTVENICVGRAVYSEEYKPDVGALMAGEEPHEIAARYDLAFFLFRVAPMSWPQKATGDLKYARGWFVDRIRRETGWSMSFVIRALRDRGCLKRPEEDDEEEIASLGLPTTPG